METGISLARWGVQSFLKVMILFFEVFLSVVRLLQVGVFYNKNSSGDEIANVNFYAIRSEGTRIR